jgi:peptide/nickel transport system substrate-binding protein
MRAPRLLRIRLLSLVAAAGLGVAAVAPAQAADKVLRVAPITDVQLLDPVFGSAWVNVVAGQMVFETLFAWDSKLVPRPMMVERWSTSPDGLTWTFVLREGLAFHDGQPVTTADVIPSMNRWMQLANSTMRGVTESLSAADDRTLVWKLRRPFPLMLDAIGAAPSRMPAIMRARDLAEPDKPVTTAIGSGPFRWNAAARLAGARAVWERNAEYKPRSEPADGLAGGRVVKVDRVEWHVIPDPATAAAALQRGEVDLWERPSVDLVQLLARNPAIRMQKLTPIATQSMLRPNSLYPPFNDKRARQALNYVIDQGDQMAAGYGDESIWRRCNSFFICGSPYGTEVGAEGFRQDFAKARELLKASGYNGEKLVFISTKDIPWIGQQAEVSADALRRAGFNIDMVWADWATTAQRMQNQGAPDKGGWNIWMVTSTGPVMAHPLNNPGINMDCSKRNFSGWPCDEDVERRRAAFLDAGEAERPAALEALHRALAEAAPYRVMGQAEQLIAFRREVSGVMSSPVIAFWNIDKQ